MAESSAVWTRTGNVGTGELSGDQADHVVCGNVRIGPAGTGFDEHTAALKPRAKQRSETHHGNNSRPGARQMPGKRRGANIRFGGVPGAHLQVSQQYRGTGPPRHQVAHRPDAWFQLFNNAATAIAGIELIRRIKKGQFKLGQVAAHRKTVPQLWAAVLAA